MERHSETKAYLSAVLEQIRYKKVHDELSKEIEAHILDQKENRLSFLTGGFFWLRRWDLNHTTFGL